VIATDRFATISDLLACIAAQSIAGDLEVVVVGPLRAELRLPPEAVGAIGSTQTVEHPVVPLGGARAAGVRVARSPVVVVAETHAFPAPDWAERLVDAHAQDWVAVMPSVANANPHSALSWSAFLVDYGRWAPTRAPAEILDPPSYHASFKRDPLLSFGDRLGVLLEPGSALAHELLSRGHRSWLDPRARISHLNVARPQAWLHERYLGGRLLGAARRARWSRARTLTYLVGSPLVPVIRLWRTRPAFVSAAREGRLPRGTRSATILGCIAWGVGEAMGYVSGAGDSVPRMVEYELHKARYLGKGDQGGGPSLAPR
jgi:hypothetical protein